MNILLRSISSSAIAAGMSRSRFSSSGTSSFSSASVSFLRGQGFRCGVLRTEQQSNDACATSGEVVGCAVWAIVEFVGDALNVFVHFDPNAVFAVQGTRCSCQRNARAFGDIKECHLSITHCPCSLTVPQRCVLTAEILTRKRPILKSFEKIYWLSVGV